MEQALIVDIPCWERVERRHYTETWPIPGRIHGHRYTSVAKAEPTQPEKCDIATSPCSWVSWYSSLDLRTFRSRVKIIPSPLRLVSPCFRCTFLQLPRLSSSCNLSICDMRVCFVRARYRALFVFMLFWGILLVCAVAGSRSPLY